MTTITLTADNAVETADIITAAVDTGDAVTVNGNRVVTSYDRPPAHPYQTGSIGYTVAAKTAGKTRELFVKPGSKVEIIVTARGARPAAAPKPAATKPVTTKPKDTAKAPAAAPAAKATSTEKPERVYVAARQGKVEGFLKTRTVNGTFTFEVVPTQKEATFFKVGKNLGWEIAKAREAGIEIAE